jgi:hypothetical protein
MSPSSGESRRMSTGPQGDYGSRASGTWTDGPDADTDEGRVPGWPYAQDYAPYGAGPYAPDSYGADAPATGSYAANSWSAGQDFAEPWRANDELGGPRAPGYGHWAPPGPSSTARPASGARPEVGGQPELGGRGTAGGRPDGVRDRRAAESGWPDSAGGASAGSGLRRAQGDFGLGGPAGFGRADRDERAGFRPTG